jgi:hypothetical protein
MLEEDTALRDPRNCDRQTIKMELGNDDGNAHPASR